MVQLEIIESRHTLLDNIGSENILIEYKEFFLKKSITLDDIHDLKQGYINSKLQRYIYETIISYIDKYYDRYLLSLTNIKKKFLPTLLHKTHSKFYIGVNDDGTITGIPVLPDQLVQLEKDLKIIILKHYENIIGLHNSKGNLEIIINNKKYYNFNNLIKILKKHTKINIHRLNKNTSTNKVCNKLSELIKKTIVEEQEYLKKLKHYKTQKKKKREYNDKYSQAFHKLIRSPVMKEFSQYTSIPSVKFHTLLKILHCKIVTHNDVEKYLKNGLYINNSLFPTDNKCDIEYGEYMRIYLSEYKDFKKKQLEKNISIEVISNKHPIKKIYPLLTNINCFNEYLDIQYCMIEIEIPFIKDINVYIGKKNKKKIQILERGYVDGLDTPCTIMS